MSQDVDARPNDAAEDPAAEEKDEALDRIVLRGAPRLHRTWYDLLATATVAGIEIGFGVLVLLVVKHETGTSRGSLSRHCRRCAPRRSTAGASTPRRP